MKTIVADENTRMTTALLDQEKPNRIINACRGRDHIDYEECAKRGVEVVEIDYSPEDSVADHALAMLLRLTVLNPKHAGGDGNELNGKKALIVGAGRIGQAIHERLYGFGVEAHYYDPYIDTPDVLFVDLKEGLGWCDYCFLACPLTKENKGMLGYQELLKLQGKVLINIARPELVDSYHLYNFTSPFFAENRDGGGIRVGWDFDNESFKENWKHWEGLNHTQGIGYAVITKHNAWRTTEARARRERAVKEALK
jgi:phosphoglycerate dehydrogenase-like enzyme